jgi:zinc D-Ala-D-Ala carboxypeptidase
MNASDIRLSPNFTLQEFIYSNTAEIQHIDNTPSDMEIMRLGHLCNVVLEPLRAHFGKPLRIISGFRCIELNRKVGGAPDSQHTRGEAADIEIKGVANADIWRFIVEKLNFDQVIAEYLKKSDPAAGWIHVSYNHIKCRKDAISCIGHGLYVKGLQFV